MEKQYLVDILMNAGGTVLYVGITNDLLERIDQHVAGYCEFTRKYRVSRLVYYETYGEVDEAIAREKQIKSWRRSKKEVLIRSVNPKLENLRPGLVL